VAGAQIDDQGRGAGERRERLGRVRREQPRDGVVGREARGGRRARRYDARRAARSAFTFRRSSLPVSL
jgi:hypothetical protein